MSTELFQVDAFAAQPFSGNPAAVCLLQEAREAQWMQAVAAEMNLSETAFLWPQENGYSLRWFTPKAEVDLCGHATLASAHVLYETRQIPPEVEARFFSKSGLLTAAYDAGWIKLNFPALPPEAVNAPPPLLSALGLREKPLYSGFDGYDYLLVAEDADAVRVLQPDFKALLAVECRGVSVTARSDMADFDFVSRFFAPWVGIDEDPVTGSAHCCLGPYWAGVLDKEDLVAYQASARGGIVRVRPMGDRVQLGGQAITVLAGQLLA
ncbi:MAG: PhzF family phenazine biosynthesis protein [Candidatus Promineifilaceae bacterium]